MTNEDRIVIQKLYALVREKIPTMAFNKNWALVTTDCHVNVVVQDWSNTTPTASHLSELLIKQPIGVEYDVLFEEPKEDFPSDHLICKMMLLFG